MIAAFVCIWAAMLIAGDTPIGRTLHRIFVECPARWLSRVRRGRAAIFISTLLGGACAIWAGGMDAVRVMAMGSPDLIMWLTTFEIATYFDVAVGVVLVASTVRVQILKTAFVGRVQRLGGAGQRRRARSQSQPKKHPGIDDGRRLLLAA